MRSYAAEPAPDRRLWAVALLVALVFTMLGVPQQAVAHNALVGTSPEDGTTVAEPPATVVLMFNEPAIATGTKVLVTGPGGSAAIGEPRLVDTTVEQDLAAGLPAGEYTVEWRVTSADGHPINGTFSFTVRTGDPTDIASPTPPAPSSPAASPSPAAETPAGTDAAGDTGDSGGSAAWWLLAIIPVGLAVVLGWRFARR